MIPSSIHEILLVPDNGEVQAEGLKEMVQEVNATEVSPEEKLSDNVYHYDSKEHIFELAEKFEARQQEKEAVPNVHQNRKRGGQQCIRIEPESLKVNVGC